ncbi:MAG: hypothetical protein RLZZ245_3614 [Verrucomicrobiota bacterium]
MRFPGLAPWAGMRCPVGANGTTECVIHGTFWSPHCLGVSGFIEFGSAPSNGATDREEKPCDEAVWYRDDKVADAWNVIVSCGVEVNHSPQSPSANDEEREAKRPATLIGPKEPRVNKDEQRDDALNQVVGGGKGHHWEVAWFSFVLSGAIPSPRPDSALLDSLSQSPTTAILDGQEPSLHGVALSRTPVV